MQAGHARTLSLDNARTLMVLAIVLLHAACAYAMGIPWWHAQDHKHVLFDLLIVSVDNFALPTLYFLAGAFARTSLDRHGASGFLARKLKRLGLPVIVISAFYLPAMVYVGYLRRAEAPASFIDYWLHWMGSLSDWGFDVITSMATGARFADAFSPHHLWFMSLLLAFFAAYALWRAAFPNAVKRPEASLRHVLAWGAVMALGYTAVNLLVQDWAWARLGPFFLFQPTRLPVYAAAFIFGIRTQSRLAAGRPMPGSVWVWLAAFIVAQAAMVACVETFMATQGPAPLPQALAHGTLRAVLTLSGICLTVNATHRFLAGPSRFRESLASSSYDVYMLHMPLVVFVQAALVPVALPLALKMAAAFVLSVPVCWGLSRVMAGRGAWLPAVLLAGFFAGFALIFSA